MRQSPRTCVRGRPSANPSALLHQWGRDEFHAGVIENLDGITELDTRVIGSAPVLVFKVPVLGSIDVTGRTGVNLGAGGGAGAVTCGRRSIHQPALKPQN